MGRAAAPRRASGLEGSGRRFTTATRTEGRPEGVAFHLHSM